METNRNAETRPNERSKNKLTAQDIQIVIFILMTCLGGYILLLSNLPSFNIGIYYGDSEISEDDIEAIYNVVKIPVKVTRYQSGVTLRQALNSGELDLYYATPFEVLIYDHNALAIGAHTRKLFLVGQTPPYPKIPLIGTTDLLSAAVLIDKTNLEGIKNLHVVSSHDEQDIRRLFTDGLINYASLSEIPPSSIVLNSLQNYAYDENYVMLSSKWIVNGYADQLIEALEIKTQPSRIKYNEITRFLYENRLFDRKKHYEEVVYTP